MVIFHCYVSSPEYVTNMKKLLWSPTNFWRSGPFRGQMLVDWRRFPRIMMFSLRNRFKARLFLERALLETHNQKLCFAMVSVFALISITHWQNKQQHTTYILNPRRTMHTIHDRLVTDGSKLGARSSMVLKYSRTTTPPKHGSIWFNHVQKIQTWNQNHPKPCALLTADRHASATNLTVPPESTCLQIKEHKRRCPQQQHLWACGGTSRDDTKQNGQHVVEATVLLEFSHNLTGVLFGHGHVFHFRCCFLGCKYTVNGGRKLKNMEVNKYTMWFWTGLGTHIANNNNHPYWIRTIFDWWCHSAKIAILWMEEILHQLMDGLSHYL